MISLVCAMRDAIGNRYSAIHLENSENEAIRIFDNSIQLAIRKNESLLATNAKDFTLCIIGTFDDESAELIPYNIPKIIRYGAEVIPNEE